MKRLTRMKADPSWQAARSIPRSDKLARTQAFARMRARYGFSEYSMHEAAKRLRTGWLASHIDSLIAQKLGSRAYQAANRVCVGEAQRVRFRSQGRGLDTVEGKTNTSGLRFHLQAGAEGNQGWLSWNGEQIRALIDWQDEVIRHGLKSRVKYVRLLRQRASSPQAQGADYRGFVYAVQLILEGHPLQKAKNMPGSDSPSLPGASWTFTGKAWRRACRPPWERPENMRVCRVSCAASVFLESERVGPNVLSAQHKSR